MQKSDVHPILRSQHRPHPPLQIRVARCCQAMQVGSHPGYRPPETSRRVDTPSSILPLEREEELSPRDLLEGVKSSRSLGGHFFTIGGNAIGSSLGSTPHAMHIRVSLFIQLFM